MGLVATFWIAVALIAHDSYKAGELPAPQRFTWIVVVWSVLGLIGSAMSPQLATAFGVGLLLAMAYYWLENPTVNKTHGGGSTGSRGSNANNPGGPGSTQGNSS